MDEQGPPREIELKLVVPEGELPRLRRHPRIRALTCGDPITRTLRSVYWDTPDLDLSHARVALRVRRVGRTLVQTVKTRGQVSAGLFTRGEWECALPAEQPDLSRIPDPEIRAQLVRAVAAKPLEPVVRTVVRRAHRVLRDADWEVLYELDVGEIQARDRSAPICELELELVRGDPAVLYDLALSLHEAVALRPAIRDKAERGFALLLGEDPVPQRARKPQLAADASVDEAMAAIFASGIEQVLANEAPARAGLDPEGVHQLRVGARRLRSALSLFRDLLPGERVEPLAEGLRWLGRECGDARDLDVFLGETLAPLLQRQPDDPALERLRDAALELRGEACDRMRVALASRRYGGLVLGLGAWIAARGWRDQPLTSASARLYAPARALADERLSRRQRKVSRLGRDLDQRTRAEKHALRIQLKKLRYAAEFFQGLYPGARAGRTLNRLTRLQDILGHLNDQATADAVLERIVERLGAEASCAHQRAAGVVSGWSARGAEDHLRRLDRRWNAFARAAPFWARDRSRVLATE